MVLFDFWAPFTGDFLDDLFLLFILSLIFEIVDSDLPVDGRWLISPSYSWIMGDPNDETPFIGKLVLFENLTPTILDDVFYWELLVLFGLIDIPF